MRHSDILIPQRWLITEAKARIDHPEDTVFDEGSAGANRALNALVHAAEQPHTVTIKWDGCVHPDSVLLTDAGEKTIYDIITDANPCAVVGHDFNTGRDTLTPAWNFKVHDNNKAWVNIEMENGHLLQVTEDHEVYVDNVGWVEAKNLVPGMEIKEYKK
jgi:hypothetical protein